MSIGEIMMWYNLLDIVDIVKKADNAIALDVSSVKTIENTAGEITFEVDYPNLGTFSVRINILENDPRSRETLFTVACDSLNRAIKNRLVRRCSNPQQLYLLDKVSGGGVDGRIFNFFIIENKLYALIYSTARDKCFALIPVDDLELLQRATYNERESNDCTN